MEVFCGLADRPRFGRLKKVAQRRESISSVLRFALREPLTTSVSWR
jgi:hypothetical protein